MIIDVKPSNMEELAGADPYTIKDAEEFFEKIENLAQIVPAPVLSQTVYFHGKELAAHIHDRPEKLLRNLKL